MMLTMVKVVFWKKSVPCYICSPYLFHFDEMECSFIDSEIQKKMFVVFGLFVLYGKLNFYLIIIYKVR